MILIQCVKQSTNSFIFILCDILKYHRPIFVLLYLSTLLDISILSILLLAAFGDCLTDRLLRFSLIYLHPIDVSIVVLVVGHSVRVLGSLKRRDWRLRLADGDHDVRGRTLQCILFSVALWLSHHADSRNGW